MSGGKRPAIEPAALLLAGLLLLAAACPAPGGPSLRDPWWPGNLVDYRGHRLPAGSLRGRVVLLVMFTTDNPVVTPLLVGIDNLGRRLYGRGLRVVGLAFDEQEELLEPFCRGLDLSFPVGLAGGELRRQVGVLPQLRLYDREGKLAKVVLGMVEMDGLKHLLERLL